MNNKIDPDQDPLTDIVHIEYLAQKQAGIKIYNDYPPKGVILIKGSKKDINDIPAEYANKQAIYILYLRQQLYNPNQLVYIGQSDRIRSRLNQHKTKKQYDWDSFICGCVDREALSYGVNLSYLEYSLYQAIRATGRCRLKNEQQVPERHIGRQELRHCQKFFADFKNLIDIIDIPLLRPVPGSVKPDRRPDYPEPRGSEPVTIEDEKPLVWHSIRSPKDRLTVFEYPRAGRFVVKANSLLAAPTPSFSRLFPALVGLRQRYLDSGHIIAKDDHYLVVKDIDLKASASKASKFVHGANYSPGRHFINDQGQTRREVLRPDGRLRSGGRKPPGSPMAIDSDQLQQISFVCTSRLWQAQARARFDPKDSSMTVLPGSVISRRVPQTDNISRSEAQLIEDGVIVPNRTGRLEFVQKHKFKSPSGASVAILRQNSNGYEAWLDPQTGYKLKAYLRVLGQTEDGHPVARPTKNRRRVKNETGIKQLPVDKVQPWRRPAEPAVESGQIKQLLFVCRKPKLETDGRGHFNPDDHSFTVLAGSVLANKSPRHQVILNQENRLIRDGLLSLNKNGRLVFTKDHRFTTPSGASKTILRASSNGYADWRESRTDNRLNYYRRQLNRN